MAKEKKLLRKIDLRLLPILVSRQPLSDLLPFNVFLVLIPNAWSHQIIMYIMNYIDRNAVPQARVQGLEKDLNLKGVEYNVVLSVTFIGYILMQGKAANQCRGNPTMLTRSCSHPQFLVTWFSAWFAQVGTSLPVWLPGA